MSGLTGLLRRRPLVTIVVAAVAAVALIAALVIRPWSDGRGEKLVAAPAPGDRVLQSVDVAMQPSGALTGIGDTVVISRAGGGDADTVSTTYDPAAVVDGLPVRVLTSYRTEQRVGTDLADLKGYTGRVQIDLTVENLTVKPQTVRYDAAGRSHTRTAMVGAPLTVVASAALPGTEPAHVVTQTSNIGAAGTGKDAAGTNGVLSQAQDQTTQVQWASILAPPQLDSTATLRLVVEAKDFTLPTFDLSVQPGLVTDPSVGALVDAAFNPKSSDELALESRTITLIGDVNQVLGRASDTISQVRQDLDSTSKTLGTKTVSDLKSSTSQVTSSMKAAGDNIHGLGEALSSSLQSTNSATLARLDESVSQLDQMLGDTSAKAAPARTTGSGCEQKVAGPAKGGSLYGQLLQVSAQLDGYAAATTECKKTLQKAIVASVGPAEPSAKTCPKTTSTPSVTCSLLGVNEKLAGVAAQAKQSQADLKGLDPTGPIGDAVDALVDQTELVVDGTDGLLAADPFAATETGLDNIAKLLEDPKLEQGAEPDVTQSLAKVQNSVTDVRKAVDGVHAKAANGQARVAPALKENAQLAQELCDLVSDTPQPGKLSARQVQQLRSHLTTRSCPDAAGHTIELPPLPDPRSPLATRLAQQETTFKDIAADTDTSAQAEQGVGPALSTVGSQLSETQKEVATLQDEVEALRKQVEAARKHVGDAQTGLTQDSHDLSDKIAKVRTSAADVKTDLTGLKKNVGDVQNKFQEAKTELDGALQATRDKADDAAKTSIAPGIRQVVKQTQKNSDEVGKMFERSASGLSDAADAVAKNGSDAVKKQHSNLGRTKAQADQSLSASSKNALSQVSGNVTSATRDLGATRTLLAGDLANVLLDLGNRKVRGTGVIGALATSADKAGSADYQLGLASDRGSAYAEVRGRDLNGIMLRQAQAEAALQRQDALPAFAMTLPGTVSHRTVFVFHLDGGR